jgi:phage baseplate assembly protein W
MALLLPGYTGQIWGAIRSTLVFANSNLSVNDPQQTKALARAIAATLENGLQAMDAGIFFNGLQLVFSNLAQLTPLPLNLEATTVAFMQNRIDAIQAATVSVQKLQVLPLPANKQLAANKPAIPDPQYIEWLMGFDFEVAPANLTLANFVATAQAAATAWTDILTALRTRGVAYSGTLYNLVALMGQAAQVTADTVIEANLVPDLGLDWLWNRMVVMPTMTRVVSAIMNDPTSATSQSTSVARYVTIQALSKFNSLIMALREVVTAQLRLGTVRQGDTLMSFANRELGDYTAWRQIAQLNGLEPPYVAGTKGLHVAIPGQQLFLPPPNSTSVITPETGPIASYVTNYLGVDIYLGPLNQPRVPWTGDYQIISGYQNLRISLGRRLQTTIGQLIYHPEFGSRIPPEIGSIASQDVTALLVEYTKSALQSDPRVNQVVSCTVTLLGNYSVVINAVVLPNGLGQEEVTVNEVIGPP